MITIARLKPPITFQDIHDINQLNTQLSSRKKETTYESFYRFLSQENVFIVIARDTDLNTNERGKIIGKASLHITQLDDGVKKATVEHVVVDEKYRGKGVADSIDEELERLAQDNDVLYIDLTSNPSRVVANKFYQKRGYVLRETNVYRKILVSFSEAKSSKTS